MYWVDVLDQVLIFGILAMSLNLLLGYAGQVSVATAAFAAIGGYLSGYLASKHGFPTGWGIVLGILAGSLIGMLVSLPALLLSNEFVILLTLSVQTIILVIVTSVAALGGELGLVDLPSLHVTKDLVRPTDWLNASSSVALVCEGERPEPLAALVHPHRLAEVEPAIVGEELGQRLPAAQVDGVAIGGQQLADGEPILGGELSHAR